MVFELPVISGAADGTEIDLVKNYETGFLLESNKEEELSERMKWCIENQNKAKEMGMNSFEFITTNYSLEKMISNIKSCIIQTIN